MPYYYAPAETTDEGITKPVGEIPPRVRSLEYDANMQRFILLAHAESTPIPDEWSQVDAALIEADYPGLLGGA
jgi:hypothetical protein